MRNKKLPKDEEGFTLFMMAILLLVAAMAAATALQQSNRDLFWRPKTETQEKIRKVVAALEAYQRENNVLPCIASRTAVQGTAAHGTEISKPPAHDPAVGCPAATVVAADTVRFDVGGGVMVLIGAVPYKELKIQEETQEDSWGNKLLYAVTERLTDSSQYMSQTGAIPINNADGAVTAVAAFVVLSHGPDGRGAYRNKTGSVYQTCSAEAGLGQENCDDDGTFWENLLNTEAGASYYDDQLEWKKVDSIAQTP